MKTLMQATLSIMALLHAGLCTSFIVLPEPYRQGCPLVTIPPLRCPPLVLHCGPHPNCELLKIVTKPCDCPTTTPTVVAPCPTCQTGCGTIYQTVAAECTQSVA
ncbi:hypothetical protein J3F83DRAFT_743194 [Trichoderma novae-zelandiae]